MSQKDLSLEEKARRYDEICEQLQTYADKQGHDRCWYFPEIAEPLMRLCNITPNNPPALPSEEEFRKGCERYRLQQYHKK